MGKYIEVTIKKPLFNNFCYIRDIYVNQAKRAHIPLRITIPQGTAIMSAQEWMDGAKEMKKVFKQPDNPMVLYGNYVRLEQEKQSLTPGDIKKGLQQLSLI
jgi:hypothetical protein